MVRGLFAFFLFLSLPLFAATENDAGEFEIQERLLDRIFEETKHAAQIDTRPVSAGVIILPRLSLMNSATVSLSNKYWDVSYGDYFSGMPAFSLGIAMDLGYWSGFSLLAEGRVGYGTKQGRVGAFNKTGARFEDIVSIHWLPLSAGLRGEYQFGAFRKIKPYAELRVGTQWIYQTGNLDGLEQGFWVTFYEFGGGLVLFDSLVGSEDWFGGITVGASQRKHLGGSQLVEAFSLDFGATFLL